MKSGIAILCFAAVMGNSMAGADITDTLQAGDAARLRNDYSQDFQNIFQKADAERFIAKFSGIYDPDDLTTMAPKRAYDMSLREAQRCIDFSNRTIANQKEIGAAVGYVDKGIMYRAGRDLVMCRKNLTSLKANPVK